MLLDAHDAVYDVTERSSFESIESVWMKEVDMYSTVENAIRMVVGNKTDLGSARGVSSEEGHELAKRHGCVGHCGWKVGKRKRSRMPELAY